MMSQHLVTTKETIRQFYAGKPITKMNWDKNKFIQLVYGKILSNTGEMDANAFIDGLTDDEPFILYNEPETYTWNELFNPGLPIGTFKSESGAVVKVAFKMHSTYKYYERVSGPILEKNILAEKWAKINS